MIGLRWIMIYHYIKAKTILYNMKKQVLKYKTAMKNIQTFSLSELIMISAQSNEKFNICLQTILV
jgi:hypothetical protein